MSVALGTSTLRFNAILHTFASEGETLLGSKQNIKIDKTGVKTLSIDPKIHPTQKN